MVDRRPDGALRRQHGDDVKPGGELDVVDRQHYGGVRQGERQRVPDLPDGEHLVLLDDLLADQPEDVGVSLHAPEVDDRDAVLPAEEVEQLLLGDEGETRQDRSQPLS